MNATICDGVTTDLLALAARRSRHQTFGDETLPDGRIVSNVHVLTRANSARGEYHIAIEYYEVELAQYGRVTVPGVVTRNLIALDCCPPMSDVPAILDAAVEYAAAVTA